MIASEVVILNDKETYTGSKGCVFVLDGVGYDVEKLYDIAKANKQLVLAIITNRIYYIDTNTNEPYYEPPPRDCGDVLDDSGNNAAYNHPDVNEDDGIPGK